MKSSGIITAILADYFRWTATAVVALILVAGYMVLLSPKVQSLQTTGFVRRANVEAELQNQQKYFQSLQESIARFHQVLPTAALDHLDTFIPTGPDFPGLLLTIKDIGQSANLQLEAIGINDVGQVATATTPTGGASGPTAAQAATVAGVNLRTQDVTVAVSGGKSYEDFKRLLTLVESSQRLLDVISVNFSQAAVEGSGTQAPYSIVVRTYYLPLAK